MNEDHSLLLYLLKNIYRKTIANGLVGGGILFGNMYNNDVELFFQREQHIARVKQTNRS